MSASGLESMQCFGFYVPATLCENQCDLRSKCRSALITHGFEIVAATIDMHVADLSELPEGLILKDTDRVEDLVKILQNPMVYGRVSKEEEELLGVMRSVDMLDVGVDEI